MAERTPTRVTAVKVIERMGPGLPALLDRMTKRRFAEIPTYSSGAAGSYADVRRSIEVNVEDAFSRLTGRKDDLVEAAQNGRLRAQQGIPLADALTSYRMGYDEVWEEMII